jgi:hypothetical protein
LSLSSKCSNFCFLSSQFQPSYLLRFFYAEPGPNSVCQRPKMICLDGLQIVERELNRTAGSSAPSAVKANKLQPSGYLKQGMVGPVIIAGYSTAMQAMSAKEDFSFHFVI